MGIGNPVVANNTVYYYTEANYTQRLHQDAMLYAFRADTGTSLWSVAPSLGYNTRGTPLLYSNGVVYVESDKLYAVDGISGQHTSGRVIGIALYKVPTRRSIPSCRWEYALCIGNLSGTGRSDKGCSLLPDNTLEYTIMAYERNCE